MFKNSFFQARIILTLWYTAFCLMLVVLLNFGALSAQRFSLFPLNDSTIVSFATLPSKISPTGNNIFYFQRTGNTTTPPISFSEINIRYSRFLLVVDILLILSSACFGYFLSGITLRPIQKTMQEQEEFIQDISHELRTPLSIITMEIEAVKRNDKSISSLSDAAFASIKNEVNTMSTLVSDLLTLFHQKTQAKKERYTRVRINDIAHDAFKSMKKLADKKPLSYSYSEKGEEMMLCIPEEVQRIFTILLDNAIKYTTSGGNVSLKLMKSDKSFVIKVVDTGMGIPKKDISFIFNRFYRVKPSKSHEAIEGHGLGLAIVKKIVEEYGGTITIRSELGKGTSISIIFPSNT